MTTTEFFTKYNGRYIDYDRAYGYQCVDLMRQYCKDVLGVNGYKAIPPTGKAQNIYYNFVNNRYFTKVANTPMGIPKKGDILFFKTSYWFSFLFGLAGHVGVVESADLYNIVLFNQNYPTGASCRFTKFKYKNCLGWLTKK